MQWWQRAVLGSGLAALAAVGVLGGMAVVDDRKTVETERSFEPVADSRISQSDPTANHGSADALRIGIGVDPYRSYLKFAVSGIGSDARAKLHLNVRGASDDQASVYMVSSEWEEHGITWLNAPALPHDPVAVFRPNKADVVVVVELGPVVERDGTYSFVLVSQGPDSARFASRETRTPPVLVVSSDGAPGASAELLAAGDIADCGSPGDEATAALLDIHPDVPVATLGDNAYPDGSVQDFAECYTPSWGRHRARTYPAVGNHEYDHDATAQAYAEYFGGRAGPAGRFWYSYELGEDWLVVVLNSECDEVGCEPGGEQLRWLRSVLDGSDRPCTLAYWHRPPYTSGRYRAAADTEAVRPLWTSAVELGVDLVLTGHEHGYERFEPLGSDGLPARDGVPLLIVGTGGTRLRQYEGSPLAGSIVRNDDAWGVLHLQLQTDGYRFEFLSAGGSSFSDSGHGRCR